VEVVIVVGVGGALGAILRWYVSLFTGYLMVPAFVGTLVVNLIGSFLIGLLFIWFQGKLPISDIFRTGILIGLLGGFTTYSAFSMEAVNMMMGGSYGRASAYVVVMVVACLMGTWAGVNLGRSV
jgi:CrcB protein